MILNTANTATKSPSAGTAASTTPPCAPGWRRTGGYTTGVVLALAGLVLAAAAATTYGLRAAGANLPAETGLVVGLRCAGGLGLVIVGFCVMVLCARGVEADDSLAVDRTAALMAAVSGDDLLCRGCGAANDHLARYCDQCGKRF